MSSNHQPSRLRQGYRWAFYVGGVSAVATLRRTNWDLTRSITLLGSRRGGTTWLQEVLSGDPMICPIFEPTLYEWDIRTRGRAVDPDLAPNATNRKFEDRLRKVMLGRHVTPWALQLASPSRYLRAEKLVVKHVNLNLSAGWMTNTFPRSPTIAIVRHPCAVVASMHGWKWGAKTLEESFADRSPEQTRRMLELLDGRTSLPAVFASMWAVEVGALLRDTDPTRVNLIAYESAVADPVGVLGPLMESVGLPRSTDLKNLSSRPSHTTDADSVTRRAGDPATAWLDRLSPNVQSEVLQVVRDAGLAGYDESPYPDLEGLAEEHRRTTPR